MLNKNRHAVGVAVLIAATLLLSGFVLFYNLGKEPFQDYDEATYAEITSESLASHHYLSFTFLQADYFRKPPLLFWINDISKSAITSPELADRLSAAVSSFLLIALLVWIVYEVTGSAYLGAFAGLVLATTAAFIEPSRQVRFDTLVSLFDVLTVYAFWKSFANRKWFLLFGAFTGLAILTKGPLVIYAAAAVFTMACIYKKFAWLRDPYFWGGILIAAGIVLPWHIYETFRSGYSFWETYLGDQVIQRIGQTLFTTQPTNLGYLAYAFEFGAPWTEIFAGLLLFGTLLTQKMSLAVRAWFWASVAGVFSVLAVDFITKTKAFSYLIPLYPFVALAVGFGSYEIVRRLSKLERAVIGVAVIICVISAFTWTVFNAFHINPYYNTEVAIATEEKDIGQYLFSRHAATFYDYDATTLGAVMFYSHIAPPLYLQSSSKVPNDSYILYTSGKLFQLQAEYPQYLILPVYEGSWLNLAQVSR
jgi:4-amino-4-deoxy-L-arabinose transferase-like glycosyltransferase